MRRRPPPWFQPRSWRREPPRRRGRVHRPRPRRLPHLCTKRCPRVRGPATPRGGGSADRRRDDHLDVEALELGAFGGEAEVEPVAGVVLDDEEASGRAGDVADGREHRGDGGTRTRRRTRRVEHPSPTDPACAGSWPDPPPETSATLFLSTWDRTTTLTSGKPSRSLTPGATGRSLQHLGDRATRVVEELVAIVVKRRVAESGGGTWNATPSA